MIDPGDGIPANPDVQLALMTRTNNGWHALDPVEQPTQGPGMPLALFKPSEWGDKVPIQIQFLNACVADLGYVEDSQGRSKYGVWYGNQPGVRNNLFDTAPWCDMFLALRTYDLLGDAGLQAVGDYALTTAHASFLHKKGLTSRPDKLPVGAFAFQNWDLNGTGNGNLEKIDHVEVVEEDHGDGTATFVGGNVDNGVRRRRRNKAYLVVIAEWWKALPAVLEPFDDDSWFQSFGSYV
jgi:hypothetical protein